MLSQLVKKPSKRTSITTETQYGHFIIKKTRKGTRRKQKLTRIPKNKQKVVIGKIGELEIYVYPYNHPNKVFLGIFPISTYIEKHNFNDIWSIANKIRWFFKEEWDKEPKNSKGANKLREVIFSAYMEGFKQAKGLK